MVRVKVRVIKVKVKVMVRVIKVMVKVMVRVIKVKVKVRVIKVMVKEHGNMSNKTTRLGPYRDTLSNKLAVSGASCLCDMTIAEFMRSAVNKEAKRVIAKAQLKRVEGET